ncbi:MAG: cytochrome c oxidase assembly protein [Pseudomonadota bacterium]
MHNTSKKSDRLAVKLAVVCLAMFGFGYLLVPLYDVFCDLTGLRFTDDVAQQVPMEIVEDSSRLVTVEFDISLNQSMPWNVKPEKVRMQVHPGKVYTTHYIAENKTQSSMVGQAVPSVTPLVANKYLIKTECFCFENQPIMAGEEVTMPLSFMINPEIPDDVNVVTLSYTFFDITKDAAKNKIASLN